MTYEIRYVRNGTEHWMLMSRAQAYAYAEHLLNTFRISALVRRVGR